MKRGCCYLPRRRIQFVLRWPLLCALTASPFAPREVRARDRAPNADLIVVYPASSLDGAVAAHAIARRFGARSDKPDRPRVRAYQISPYRDGIRPHGAAPEGKFSEPHALAELTEHQNVLLLGIGGSWTSRADVARAAQVASQRVPAAHTGADTSHEQALPHLRWLERKAFSLYVLGRSLTGSARMQAFASAGAPFLAERQSGDAETCKIFGGIGRPLCDFDVRPGEGLSAKTWRLLHTGEKLPPLLAAIEEAAQTPHRAESDAHAIAQLLWSRLTHVGYDGKRRWIRSARRSERNKAPGVFDRIEQLEQELSADRAGVVAAGRELMQGRLERVNRFLGAQPGQGWSTWRLELPRGIAGVDARRGIIVAAPLMRVAGLGGTKHDELDIGDIPLLLEGLATRASTSLGERIDLVAVPHETDLEVDQAGRPIRYVSAVALKAAGQPLELADALGGEAIDPSHVVFPFPKKASPSSVDRAVLTSSTNPGAQGAAEELVAAP